MCNTNRDSKRETMVEQITDLIVKIVIRQLQLDVSQVL